MPALETPTGTDMICSLKSSTKSQLPLWKALPAVWTWRRGKGGAKRDSGCRSHSVRASKALPVPPPHTAAMKGHCQPSAQASTKQEITPTGGNSKEQFRVGPDKLLWKGRRGNVLGVQATRRHHARTLLLQHQSSTDRTYMNELRPVWINVT